MLTILKTSPLVIGEVKVSVPKGSRIISVDVRNSQVCAWYLCENTEWVMEERRLFLTGTGQFVPYPMETLRFLNTIQDPSNVGLVWHVFEVVKVAL